MDKRQGQSPMPELREQGTTKVLYVDGEPFVMLAGEVHNSAGSSLPKMEGIWERVEKLGLNSLLVPVTWELIEPEEGVFDFAGVDGLLAQARAHGMRLGILWFGAWKNAQCFYAPEWVKADLDRFWRAEMTKGQPRMTLRDFHGMTYSTLSALCPATREADARAFGALMAHLREADVEHTVVMVQVENETGFMGAAREHSDVADAAFAGDVPADLVAYMRESEDGLAPDVREALLAGAGEGSWEDVFGPVAEELFTAYNTASYVQFVAEAGKAELPLPMSVNCWLDKGHKPGRFPSGGPVARVMEVWHHVAPAIDVVGPDIYVPYFCDVCDSYRKLGNPLCIPEAATHAYASSRELWAVGHHHAVCYSPFGIEELGEPFGDSAGILFGMDTSDPALATPQDPKEYAAVNRALCGLMPLLGPALGSSRLQAVTSERPDEHLMRFGSMGLDVSFDGGPGACLALQVGQTELYLVALRCSVTPVSLDEKAPYVDVLCLEDGEFVGGAWQRDQRLNGDEVTIMHYVEPTLLRMRLLIYG